MNLPPNVTAAPDRHGKMRYRFRKVGLPSRSLPEPTSPDFERAYRDCFDASTAPAPKVRKRPRKRNWNDYRGKSWVYFIGLRGGAVKIGTTVNLPARLKKLQTGSPSKLRVLACVEGGADLEAEYHKRFAQHRLHGEWFSGKGPIRHEIVRLNSPGSCQTCALAELSNLQKAPTNEGKASG